MERIFVVSDVNYLTSKVADKLNEWLENGWSVKSVTSAATKDHMTFVFVLEEK